MENYSTQELIYCAKLTEQIEQYDKMLQYMQALIQKGEPFGVEERNLLSVAYKNAVGPLRTSWRIIDTIEKKEKGKADNNDKDQNVEHISRLKKNIEDDLQTTCNDIINVLENTLIPSAHNDESKVFYLKMKGDYYRYLAEFKTECDDGSEGKVSDKALLAYTQALELAEVSLSTTDPIRLGLALNFSVFHYEIKNDPRQAC